MQSQYRHGLVSLTMEPLYFIMTCPSMPGLEVGPAARDPNCPFQCRMTTWTIRRPHVHTHFRHH